jgi:hypothetical protein
MDKEEICRLLPVEPPEGLVDWTIETCGIELGGEFCVFNCEQMPVGTTFTEIMEHNSMASRRKAWGAVCHCSACSDEFITQKEPGMSAIRLVVGEDEWHYTLDIGETVDPYMGIQVQREGDTFPCPLCGSVVELIHAKHLRGGRTKQIMVISVQNVATYTALIYWLVYRVIDEYGLSCYSAIPADAFVLTETGATVRFTKVKRGGYYYTGETPLTEWKVASRNQDTIDQKYHDWRSINNKKVGADVYRVFPDLEGSTGEKTALVEYLQAGGYRPVEYLKWWRRRPNIENLCRQGQASLVASIVSTAWRYSSTIDSEAEKYIDLSKRKPHEMLHMSKQDFRYLRQSGAQLTTDSIRQWREYRQTIGKLSLAEFTTYSKAFGPSAMNAAIGLMRQYGDADLDKIARYMEKSKLKLNEVGILLDTRNCMHKLYNRPLTSEELWPKHLHETHDRVTRMWAAENERKHREELLYGFQKVIDQYGHLQWTDGELSVILPKSNAELVQEGEVLRHCVGGYGNAHVQGRSMIFFIRHYRRPERPYYTLAINMTGRPVESQLHGYGNERHGDHKQYTHKIPKKVRDFCDRWENEVLLAWYAEQQKCKEAKTA